MKVEEMLRLNLGNRRLKSIGHAGYIAWFLFYDSEETVHEVSLHLSSQFDIEFRGNVIATEEDLFELEDSAESYDPKMDMFNTKMRKLMNYEPFYVKSVAVSENNTLTLELSDGLKITAFASDPLDEEDEIWRVFYTFEYLIAHNFNQSTIVATPHSIEVTPENVEEYKEWDEAVKKWKQENPEKETELSCFFQEG